MVLEGGAGEYTEIRITYELRKEEEEEEEEEEEGSKRLLFQ